MAAPRSPRDIEAASCLGALASELWSRRCPPLEAPSGWTPPAPSPLSGGVKSEASVFPIRRDREVAAQSRAGVSPYPIPGVARPTPKVDLKAFKFFESPVLKMPLPESSIMGNAPAVARPTPQDAVFMNAVGALHDVAKAANTLPRPATDAQSAPVAQSALAAAVPQQAPLAVSRAAHVGPTPTRAAQPGPSGKQGWSREEDELIVLLVQKSGPRWSTIAAALPGRTDDAVRNRYLRLQKRKGATSPEAEITTSDLAAWEVQKKGDMWTAEEDALILRAVDDEGLKWTQVAALVPGRSANAVRNRYIRCSSAAAE